MSRRPNIRTLSALLGVTASLLQPASVGEAATANALMPVTATVLASCTVTALPLVFGNYQGAQLDVTSSISVICTNGTAYNVGLDQGANAASGARRMVGAVGGQFLNYSLARDAAFAQPWGTTIGTDTLAGTSLGVLSTVTVHGRIAAGQSPSPGAYTDSVTITLTY